MGRSYSEDLRLKVLAAVDCGLSKMQAHRVFRVSRSTIDDWLNLRTEQGHVQTKPPVRSRGGALGHACGFDEFVSRHKGCTLSQMSRAWEEETGQKLSANTFCVALRRLAARWLYAQKKSFLYAERDEVRREEFLEQLSHIAPEDRVYVDEAGVEDTLSWAYGWSRKGSRCQGERLGHRTSRISMAAAWCCGP